MNGLFKVFVFLLFSSLMACTTMEQDAAKMAQLQCEAIEITMGGALDAMDGAGTDMKVVEEHAKKVQRFTEKMLKNYERFEDRQKFQALVMEKSMENCL